MLSRRSMMGKLAAGAVVSVAWAGGAARASAAVARGKTPDGSESNDGRLASAPVVAPPPWDLLRPLVEGSIVAHGWRVTELSGVVDGACVLTLCNQRGRAFRIHLCRNDGRPHGLVYTDRVDLMVMNGGQGDLPTDEGLAQAVAAVAHVLAANEGDRQIEPQVATLLPHAERLRRFAGEESRLR